jgi:hypothetical protein
MRSDFLFWAGYAALGNLLLIRREGTTENSKDMACPGGT